MKVSDILKQARLHVRDGKYFSAMIEIAAYKEDPYEPLILAADRYLSKHVPHRIDDACKAELLTCFDMAIAEAEADEL